MKILNVQKAIVYYVTTDQEEHNEYTRRGSDNWTVTMGQSDETHNYCDDIEKLFQEFIKENSIYTDETKKSLDFRN